MFELIFKHQFGGTVYELGGWWELMCKVDTSLSFYLGKPLHGQEVEKRKDLGWGCFEVKCLCMNTWCRMEHCLPFVSSS